MKLDLVTVVYQEELDLLRTQARSMSLRFRPEHINQVIVLINDNMDVAEKIDPEWFGHLGHKVNVLQRRAFGYTPSKGISGWQSQQLMKLMGVAVSTADWCMVLDAKTWFIKDYDPWLFFDGSRAKMDSFPVPEVFQKGQKYLESLFGIDSSSYIAPGGVPNLMKPDVVREMIGDISEMTGQNFVEWFEENCRENRNSVSEFVCHSVYVCYKHGIDKFYCGNCMTAPQNLADWEVDRFDDWYGRIHKSMTFTVSIQKKALNLLTDEQKQKWQQYLQMKNLA